MTESRTADWVGPVLRSGPLAQAARAAIHELNPLAEFYDQGSYLRVLAPERCRLTRQALEKHAGTSLSFPGDLESILTSFKGRFSITEDEARWEAFGEAGRA
jgi:toluene monooxygenase system protein D